MIPESALLFQSVHKRYRDRPVLAGIDLTVRAGEFFALVGANGVGKTTLIKGMLDFHAMNQGEIRIFGTPHHQDHARNNLAYLPERFTPPGFFTGADFLRYMLALHHAPYQRDAVLAELDALDLDASALDRPVRGYSKGMTQKLGLAACFLANKPLLILDEPMSGLDPKARVLLKRQLLARRQAGTTLFFSTHLLADVEELCDRMAILHEGELRFVGSPRECRQRYPGATLEESFIHCVGEPAKRDQTPCPVPS